MAKGGGEEGDLSSAVDSEGSPVRDVADSTVGREEATGRNHRPLSPCWVETKKAYLLLCLYLGGVDGGSWKVVVFVG